MKIGSTEIEVVRGSVLEQDVAAIVNAANTGMRGGGALDGAVHRAAGRRLLAELEGLAPHGAETGEAIVTGGHNLRQKNIIHVAGPVWDARNPEQSDRWLVQSYHSCLEAAAELELESLAFPSLSTGVFGFPIERAAPLAVGTVVDFLQQETGSSLRRVLFAMYGENEFRRFEHALALYQKFGP